MASTSIQVTVLNAPPLNLDLDLGLDQQVLEGQAVQLNAVFRDPGEADAHTIRWSVAASNGQVVPGGAGPRFVFVPVNNGTYVVRVVVTDDDGAVATDTVTVTALNRAPQDLSLVQQPTPGSASAGETFKFSRYFRDVAGDSVRATIDFGDGTAVPLLVQAVPNADVNHDRVVNDIDLYLVWQNLLKPPADRDLRFDLNGDGAVTLDDVAIVQASYRLGLATTMRGYSFAVQHTLSSDRAVHRDCYRVGWGRRTIRPFTGRPTECPRPRPCSRRGIAGSQFTVRSAAGTVGGCQSSIGAAAARTDDGRTEAKRSRAVQPAGLL